VKGRPRQAQAPPLLGSFLLYLSRAARPHARTRTHRAERSSRTCPQSISSLLAPAQTHKTRESAEGLLPPIGRSFASFLLPHLMDDPALEEIRARRMAQLMAGGGGGRGPGAMTPEAQAQQVSERARG